MTKTSKKTKVAKKPKMRVRKLVMKPTEVVRIVAHKDIVHQAVVHKEPGVVEIVPVTRPVTPLKKPGTWWEYLFGDS